MGGKKYNKKGERIEQSQQDPQQGQQQQRPQQAQQGPQSQPQPQQGQQGQQQQRPQQRQQQRPQQAAQSQPQQRSQQGQQQQRPQQRQQQRPQQGAQSQPQQRSQQGQQQQQRPQAQQQQRPQSEQQPLPQQKSWPQLGQQKGPPQQQRQEGQQAQQVQQQQRQAPQAAQQQQGPSPKQQLRETEPQKAQADVAAKFGSMAIQPATPGMICKPKGYGSLGKVLQPIETNYLQINFDKMPQSAWHYDVKFDPDQGKKSFPKAFQNFVAKNFPNIPIAFDGKASAYSAKQLDLTNVNRDADCVNPETNQKRSYKISLTAAKNPEIHLSLLKQYKKEGRTDVIQRALQCFEVVMKNAFNQPRLESGVMHGRSFYLRPNGRGEYLGDYFELWLGLFQSTVLGDMPFLNVDIAHKAFPKSYSSLIDIFRDMEQDRRFQRIDLNRPINDDVKKALEKHLGGLDIRYLSPKDKMIYERKFLSIKSPPEQIMFAKDGKNISVLKYFEQELKTKIQYPQMPCIEMGNKIRTITVPIEFCSLSNAQGINRKCTENQTRAIIKVAATSTDVRKKKIMDMINNIRHNDSTIIKGFGIDINNQFTKVPARQLNAPAIEYANRRTENVVNGVWKIDRQEFLQPQSPLKYACINLNFRTADSEVFELCKQFHNYGKSLNMLISERADCYEKIGDRDPTNKLKKVMEDIARNRDIKIVFCIISGFNSSIYSTVKKMAELKCGVLTQCIKDITVARKRNDGSTIVNLLLKVNAKLNGTNHKLHKSPMLDGKCMIIGADVTHPSPDQRDIPSVVGVAASHDQYAFKYNIDWRIQEGRVEIIQDFRSIIKKQLTYFKKQNGTLPEKIFYYRDGVSEGQFQQVMGAERQGIVAACRDMDQRYAPKLTLIIVQKRHHTRFFPGTTGIGDRKNNNVPAGTIVDRVITNPNENNFFLCSHASIQGVSKPAKYCILLDDGNHSMDVLQTFTYDLCHLFTRCNRTVSYPAPTYYAHLVAYRGRVYLEGERMKTRNWEYEWKQREIKSFIINDHPMFFV